MPITTPAGIFILGELTGALGDRIHAINRRFDPKLANSRRPHLTLAGSSGVGPIAADTPVARLREVLEPITSTTAPMQLQLEPPHRFPQTQTIVLPIDSHGPLRVLHDRIAASGLNFDRARFTFSPHVTLNLYRTLTPEAARELLALRITEPVLLDRIQLYYTNDPQPARKLLELPLTGSNASSHGH